MYLAISAVAAMCAFLAAVQTRNAKRLGEDLRQKTVEAESFQLAARTMEERMHTEGGGAHAAADRITKGGRLPCGKVMNDRRLRQELQTERRKFKAAGRTRLHQGCTRRGNQRDVERPQRG